MATLNATVAGPESLLQALVDHLSGDSGTPGRDWTVTEDLRDVDGLGAVVFGNTGASGASPIFVGFNLVSAGDGAHYALCYRVFRSWTAGTDTDFFNTPLGNTSQAQESSYSSGCCCAVALAAGGANLFCQSSKDRIVLACEFSGRYSTNYMGRFLPWALPGEYPNPIACFGDAVYKTYGNGYFDLCEYDSTPTDSLGSIWYPNAFDKGDGTTLVDNTYGWRKCHSVALPGNNYQMAEVCNNDLGDTSRRYFAGAPRLLLPIWLTYRAPVGNIWTRQAPIGQLDGVYWCPDPQSVAWGTVTMDGTTYRLFPEHRSISTNHFIAVLED